MQNDKDVKPPYQTELESVEREKEDVKRDGWNAGDVSDEASLKSDDEIRREFQRGDESMGEPDKRDAAGTVDNDDTPQGREEKKNDLKGAANQNG